MQYNKIVLFKKVTSKKVVSLKFQGKYQLYRKGKKKQYVKQRYNYLAKNVCKVTDI